MKKKPAKKKIAKKAIKKVVRKGSAPKKRISAKRPQAARAKKEKPIGKVTHFYTHIKVAIVKFNVKVKAGTSLHYKGATTDFIEAAKSMQYDHKAVAAAPAKKLIGIKVKKRVRDGDLVYKT